MSIMSSVNFGQNIQLLRKRKKISQEDLARELEIKRSSLSGYELGNTEPNFDTLLKISNFFKISTDKLLKLDLKSISDLYLSQLEQGIDIDLTGGKLRVLATTVDNENEEKTSKQERESTHSRSFSKICIKTTKIFSHRRR